MLSLWQQFPCYLLHSLGFKDESQLSRLFNVNRCTRRCIIVACEKGEVNDCLTDDLTFAAREVLFPIFTATRGFGKK